MAWKDLLKPILWFARTFEDDKGIPDHKRTTAFAFCVLVAFMVLDDKINSYIRLYAFFALLVTVLLLYNIIKSQDITEFRHGFGNKETKPEPTQEQEIKIEGTLTTKENEAG
jgi:hypothetical protein